MFKKLAETLNIEIISSCERVSGYKIAVIEERYENRISKKKPYCNPSTM